MFEYVYAGSYDAAAATETASTGSAASSWILMIGIFVVMYLFMIRPQNKKQKEEKKMRDSLRPGMKVVTIGGICGTVARVKEDSDRVVIMVGSDRVKIEILKAAIQSVESIEESAPAKSAKKAEEEAEAVPGKPNKKNIKKLGAAEETPAAEAVKAEKPAEEKAE